ncbi:hypothetical protein B0A52_00933 [Exophiala mesophila]|uniref:Major facilitator superfamily (MFS) profile domain-containing protein n=1 Tax=Exophiala mesophila TaxID=212818 RepID=A0A438NIP7_EXOME|nr:hypothetical protein B0A52_00933 [Exophiala mesophila]
MDKPTITVEVVSTTPTKTSSDSKSTLKVSGKRKHKHTWAVVWCIYALWCTLANNYAYWQAAYYGAPQAAAVMGAISVAWTADKIGRRLALGLVLSFRILSITLETVATTNPVFFGGRFVGGFSTGAMNTLCMTYIGEITPLRLRGVLTAAAPIALILGSFSAAIMVAYTGDQSSRWAYRTAFISSYGFVAVALIFLPFMPESPWWLINQDQNGRAIHALSRLGYVVDAEARASEIRRVLAKTKEETSGATYAECFQRSNLRRTVVSAMPLTIQTFSGVAFVASYSTYYQQLAGYSTAASFRLFIAQQVLSGSGNVCSWFLVDRLGRRPLTFWGMIILTALLMVTGGLAIAATPGAIQGTIALLLLYCFIYNATIGATAFTILTEIATPRLRAKTASISIALQSSLFTMWGFVLPYLFNPNKANLGAKVTFIFGGISVFSIGYLWYFQPESSGLSYEILDELFIKQVPARKFKSYALARTQDQDEKTRVRV